MSNNQSIVLNPALAALQPSATLVINERSAALIKQGKTVYRLGFGQSPFPVPPEVVQALQKYAFVKDYLPVKGLPELCQSVAAFNQRTLGITSKPENILIAPGSKQLIYGLKLALNGVVLLPNPSWVSYEPQAQLVQKQVEWLETLPENGWRLTPEILEKACQKHLEQTKILILNYPNNPVGNTYDATQLKALAIIAKRYNIVIIADEIYGEIHHKGQHETIAKYYPSGTILSGGLSKWCGAGGWRLGTFTFPEGMEHIVDMMAKIASETYTSVAAPIQYAAITAFDGSPNIERYIKNSRVILRTIAQYVHQNLVSLGIEVTMPEGGFYVFPDFKFYKKELNKKDIFTSTALCETLLEETGIALLPGVAFGQVKTNLTARLSFVDFDGTVALEALRKGEPCDVDFIKKYCPKIEESMIILSKWVKYLNI